MAFSICRIRWATGWNATAGTIWTIPGQACSRSKRLRLAWLVRVNDARLSVFRDQVRDQTGPTCLMTGAQTTPGVAVEVLIKLQVVAEIRVGLLLCVVP